MPLTKGLIFFIVDPTIFFLNAGNLEEAVNCYTQAIMNNPASALLYAKRARQVTVK